MTIMEGRVSGFKLNTLKQPLQNPPTHVRFGNKDYIVFARY